MTTYTYSGFFIEFDDDDNLETFEPTNISFVTAPGVSTLTYAYGPGANEDGLRPIQPVNGGEIYNLLVDGAAERDDDAFIAQVTWFSAGSFKTTIFLSVDAVDGGSFLVYLDGDDPGSTAQDIAALNASITGIGNVASGPFAPNTPINLAAIPTASVTQNDFIFGFDDGEVLDGGIGNDSIFGGEGDDSILGGSGNDTIDPGLGNDTVVPGVGNDRVILTAQSDPGDFFELHMSELGNGIDVDLDAIANTGSVDKGGDGVTTLVDLADAVSGDGMSLHGTNSDDTYEVRLDQDDFLILRPNLGDDTITVAPDNLGFVRLDYRGSPFAINADLGAKTVSVDVFTDTIVGDISELRGSNLNDTLLGSAENDSFILRRGDDTVDGAGGFDRVRYDRSGVSDLSVDLAAGTATGTWNGEAFTDSLTSIEYISGTRDGNDLIRGSGEDERLRTFDGDDTIEGRGGNDTIEAGGGTDTAILATGLDAITSTEIDGNGALVVFTDTGISSFYQVERFEVDGTTYSQAELIEAIANNNPGGTEGATTGDDLLTGDDTGEEFISLDGDDTIDAGGGDDTVDAGDGLDTAILSVDLSDVTSATENGDGSITVVSPEGTDTFTSVEFFVFNGTIVTSAALLQGGPFSTVPSDGNDLITGGDGIDRVDGGTGNDTINGGAGNDGLQGRDGDDLLIGGPGDDRLPGAEGNDTLIGNDGNDNLGGGGGNDLMIGGAGNDRGGAGTGDDTIYGGDGNDIFNGGQGNDLIWLGAGNDRSGGSFTNDTIHGQDGDDTLGGGEGFDLIFAGAGNDDVGAGGFDDTVYGGDGDDFIGGGDGDDSLFGEAGDDTINSGLGDDTVNGGDGADQFIFNALYGGGITVIEDFEDGTDVIRVVGLRNPPDPVGRLDITDTTFDGQQAVEMSYGDHTIIVLGTQESDFTTDDFLFM